MALVRSYGFETDNTHKLKIQRRMKTDKTFPARDVVIRVTPFTMRRIFDFGQCTSPCSKLPTLVIEDLLLLDCRQGVFNFSNLLSKYINRVTVTAKDASETNT